MDYELTASDVLVIINSLRENLKEMTIEASELPDGKETTETTSIQDVMGYIEFDDGRVFEVSMKLNSDKKSWLLDTKTRLDLIKEGDLFYIKQSSIKS